jgi:electron transfer flavoprotein alpha subunit
MFEPLEPRDSEPRIEPVELDGLEPSRVRLVDRRPLGARDLDAGDVVLCLGPDLARDDVAEALAMGQGAGIPVGGTREVCERGDLPHNRQIGLYGRPVAPRLLVAVGLTGTFEQLTGFVKAGVIAAVNAARDAPMLSSADVGLVGDWHDHVPRLIDISAS